MRLSRLIASGVVAAALLCLASGTALADGEMIVEEKIVNIGATQQVVGVSAVGQMVKYWGVQAKQKRQTIAEYIDQNLRAKPFHGHLDPAGRVRIEDGHHRGRALAQLASRYEEQAGKPLTLNVRIDMDYRGWPQKRYAAHLIKVRHKGQFRRDLQRYPTWVRAGVMPKQISKCADSACRSAVGTALFRLKTDRGLDFDALKMPDYVEFKLQRYLEKKFRVRRIKVKKGAELKPETTARLQSYILSDKGLAYIAAHAAAAPEVVQKFIARAKQVRKLPAEEAVPLFMRTVLSKAELGRMEHSYTRLQPKVQPNSASAAGSIAPGSRTAPRPRVSGGHRMVRVSRGPLVVPRR